MVTSRYSSLMASAAVVVILSQAGCSSLKLPLESVNEIAPQVTVRIDGCASGSGVIVKKAGNTYSVLTARHVIESNQDCLVVTADQEQHQAKAETFQRYQGLDLALMQFTSDSNYRVAKLGNSETATIGKVVYVAGTPTANETVSRTFRLTDGKIIGRSTEGTHSKSFL